MQSRKTFWLICLSLAIVTFAIYAPVIHYDFVNYDDPEYVTENAHIKAEITIDGVKWAFQKPVASNWHPLTMLSHMLDCQIYGMNPGGHHFTNLLFHVANTLLLFLIFRKMTKATPRPITIWR